MLKQNYEDIIEVKHLVISEKLVDDDISAGIVHSIFAEIIVLRQKHIDRFGT